MGDKHTYFCSRCSSKLKMRGWSLSPAGNHTHSVEPCGKCIKKSEEIMEHFRAILKIAEPERNPYE